MPSGATPHPGGQGTDAQALGAGGGTQRADGGRVAAMGKADAPAALPALGRARAGAQAAMHPAPAVLHGRLAAGAAGASAGAAARRGQEVAGLGSVP